jgi:hypothetical protein
MGAYTFRLSLCTVPSTTDVAIFVVVWLRLVSLTIAVPPSAAVALSSPVVLGDIVVSVRLPLANVEESPFPE